MVAWRRTLVVLFVISVFAAESPYVVPEVQIEVLNSGKLRVYIPDVEGTTFFAFHANVDEAIARQAPGTIFKDTSTKTGSFWVLNFDHALKVGETLYFWVFVTNNRGGYFKEGSWEITELRDSFSTLPNPECIRGSTIINGGQSTCAGSLILEDEFNGASVDRSKWVVEHRIPTYTGPNFEFNSYKNRDDVRFIKDGVLYLKPKALRREEEVRGTIDLTKGCTSDDPLQCQYTQASSFLLPPVICAKIRSKISFKYGKVEIKAQLPSGDWIYPILELEPKEKIDGENSAKIWIAYSRGNDVLKGNGEDDYGSRLLFGGPVLHPTEPGRSKALATQRAKAPYSNEYHVYTMEWKPGRITLYVDNIQYGDISTTQNFADPKIGIGATWTGSEAPFDREYVLLLGVAVGGINDFPDGFNSANDPKPWLNDERNYIKNFFDARNVWSKTWKSNKPALKIDYVKVTAL